MGGGCGRFTPRPKVGRSPRPRRSRARPTRPQHSRISGSACYWRSRCTPGRKRQNAPIGRAAAVAQFGKFELSGYFAWLAWLFVHIFFLIGFRNRLLVMIQWAWSYLTYERGARLITGSDELPGWTQPKLQVQTEEGGSAEPAAHPIQRRA